MPKALEYLQLTMSINMYIFTNPTAGEGAERMGEYSEVCLVKLCGVYLFMHTNLV